MSSSTAMAVDKPDKINVDEYLTTVLSTAPQELHPLFESLQTLYHRKLWHQLTLKLFEFFRHELSRPYRVDVFEKFVRDFEERLNQLRLVEMGVIVSKEIDNPVTVLSFLTALLSRINTEESPEAHVLLLSSLAHAKLLYGDLDGTRTDMDSAWKILDDLDGVDPAVNAAYYSVAADYYKAKADYGPYYKNSLLYLACIDLAKDLSEEERMLRAHNLSVAALLADNIYNFGELLMHSILSSLDGTPHEWIKKLLFTFNAGDIGKFEALAPLFPKEPILQQNYPFLRQKICLMALIDSVSRRNRDSRTISFQTIAEETRLDVGDVEHLVMKALSLGLVRGSLDEIDQTAHITWVQPRVLDREQIGALADRLKAWTDKLKNVEQRIAPEVLTSA
ncbi:RPN9 [Sanghuangporus weigelae]